MLGGNLGSLLYGDVSVMITINCNGINILRSKCEPVTIFNLLLKSFKICSSGLWMSTVNLKINVLRADFPNKEGANEGRNNSFTFLALTGGFQMIKFGHINRVTLVTKHLKV